MALLSAACGPTGSGDEGAVLTPLAVATAPVTTTTPAVIDCGVEERALGRDRDLASRDCLMGAYTGGRPATWISRLPTVEGDPIVVRVSVLGPAAIEVRVDNTADRFAAPGDRGVVVHRCTALAVDPVTQPPTFLLSGCTDRAGGEIRL
jgi:hypothetical protein